MKILLVVYDNQSYISIFPIGLAYLASTLKLNGYEVAIYNQDTEHYPDEHLTDFLDNNHYDFVGVSVIAGYYQYRKLIQISKAINRSKKRPVYIIGGHGPSPEPEYFLKKTEADIAVIGEGESTIIELLEALGSRSSLHDVKGIAFCEGDRVTVTPPRPLIKEIDNIARPAYELFPVEHYRLIRLPHASKTDFVLPMLSGRGCTFECTFCYRMDKGFRERSPDSIADEIKWLKKKYGITYIAFFDELLMSSVERTMELCETFLREEVSVKWECNGRLNYARPEVLKLMKRSGCVFINYGIEAMDDGVLKKMKKGLTTDIIINGIEATLSAGLSPGYNIIYGNIGDNRETLKKGVNFLLKYDDGAQMRTIRPVTPYPGSPLYFDAIEKGLLKDCQDFYENKHLNSDLLAVNFTEMTDDEFYQNLFDANKKLLENYFSNKMSAVMDDAEELYVRRNAKFRGFRQF